jgi:Sec-independent protein translocase protein TatA
MTKIETLELGIVNLKNQIAELQNKEYELDLRQEAEMKEFFSNYFQNVVSDEVVVEVYRNTIYFKMKDERDYLKEIFQIYFSERYSMKEEDKFTNVDLSYYTTSTNSDFELIRLENLGRVANVVRNFKKAMKYMANEIARKYTKELKESGWKRYALENLVRESNQKIAELKRQEQKARLFGEGMTFEKGTYVRLKGNFEPKISKLKLIPNKSGKTATAEFEYSGINDKIYTEENVNIERVLANIGLGF